MSRAERLAGAAVEAAGRSVPLAVDLLREAVRIPADYVDRDLAAGGAGSST